MFTINWTGTTLYWKSDYNTSDWSYISTKWFVFAWIPIIPLCSYKVVPWEYKGYIIYNNQKFLMKNVPMHWKQIKKTYTKMFIIISIIFIIFFVLYYINNIY
jgi:hypothetical protein